jgi:cyanophycin synthetase
VIEVNAGPGLLMHVKPAVGQPRPVGKAIVDHLFGPNDSGRIPVVGIVGTEQTTQLAQLVAWLLHLSGHRTGLACKDGLYMNQHHLGKHDARGFEDSERLLINRALDAAVFETTPLHILEEGLAYDRCQVGVVTDMPETTQTLIDQHDIQTLDQMRTVIRTQVDLVLPEGASVLNAQDDAVVGLAELSDGEVLFYAQDANNTHLAAHRQQGGRAVYCQEGFVTLARGDQETPLFHLDMDLIARLLKQGLHINTLLAAVATGWSLGITPLLIRAGLKNFGQKHDQVVQDLARMNG